MTRTSSPRRSSDRRAAARLAAADPQRECRAAHLPHACSIIIGGARAALDALPDMARRGGAAKPARICTPRGGRARDRGRARGSASRWSHSGEPDYPARLRMIDDAPPLIGGARQDRGAGAADDRGGRLAQRLGRRREVRRAASRASSAKRASSSCPGLARGIDAAAHRASLASGTVAVLAGGHDHIYPPEHVGLLEQILASGAAVSEMPIGWEPRGARFSPPQPADLRARRSASSSSRRRGAPAR